MQEGFQYPMRLLSGMALSLVGLCIMIVAFESVKARTLFGLERLRAEVRVVGVGACVLWVKDCVWMCVCVCVCLCVCVCVCTHRDHTQRAVLNLSQLGGGTVPGIAGEVGHVRGLPAGTQFTCFTSTKVQILTQKLQEKSALPTPPYADVC